MIRISIQFLILTLCFSQFCQAATYHVITDGLDSDSRDGLSPEAAWASLAYACERVPEGEHTIQLAPGIYTATKTAYPKNGVTIVGSSSTGRKASLVLASKDWKIGEAPCKDYSMWTPVEEYLIALPKSQNVTLRNFALKSHPEHRISGAFHCQHLQNVTFENLRIEEFRWAGIHIEYGQEIEVAHCHIQNASTDRCRHQGGLIRTRWIKNSRIHHNTIIGSKSGEKGKGGGYGYKGGGHENVRIDHNVIDVGYFSIESAHENEYGVQIDHNELHGCVSIPKGGPQGDPNERGYPYSFWIHNNYMTDSYTIEGPRNYLRFEYNHVDIKRPGGRVYTHHGGKNHGPVWINNNVVENVDRAFVWMNNGLAENIFVTNNTVFCAVAGERKGAIFGAYSAERLGAGWVVRNNVFIAPKSEPRKLFPTQRGVPEAIKYSHNLCINIEQVPDGNFAAEDPGFQNSGEKPWPYYAPANEKSFVVDKGIKVDRPFKGKAPDLGAYELGMEPNAKIVESKEEAQEPPTPQVSNWHFAPPANSGVINVRNYGAKGDGKNDDTEAIRKAIAENIDTNRYRANPMIYFPNGTYRLTDSIESRNGTSGWSAGWRSGLVLIGESRDGTILKLDDAAPGFTDKTKPKWLVAYGSESDNRENFSGGGNRAFRHGLLNLTVDVGKNNPGAIGVDFIANNRGTIDNVTIRAGENSGHTGIAMTRNWPGPAMIMDTRIEGFAMGMDIRHYQYGMTFENIQMVGQTQVGIRNHANVLTMRKVEYHSDVPFYVGNAKHAMLCLLDSNLYGKGVAIETHGMVNLRRCDFKGFQNLIFDESNGFPKMNGNQFIDSLDKGPKLNASSTTVPKPLNLPIEEIPNIRAPKGATWKLAQSGEELQMAIDSGAEYIYLTPAKTHKLEEPLVLRGKLKLLFGLNGSIQGPEGKPALIVDYGDSKVVQLEHMTVLGGILHNSTRTLVLRHTDNGKDPFVGAKSGTTHVIDTIGRDYRILNGHKFFARQLNSEFGSDPLFSNWGGQSWILGFKMESSTRNPAKGSEGTPSFVNSHGGKLEIFGGFLYTLGNKNEHAPTVPAFTNTSGKISISYRKNGIPSTYYKKILVTGPEKKVYENPGLKAPGAALLVDER